MIKGSLSQFQIHNERYYLNEFNTVIFINSFFNKIILLYQRELGIGREWVYTEPIPAGAAIIT